MEEIEPVEDEAKKQAVMIRAPTTTPPGLFQVLYAALFAPKPSPTDGPIVRPGIYRSYASIYERLALIPSHHPPHTPQPLDSSHARLPFRVCYNMWKPQPQFKKSDPPPPDFRIAVVAARDEGVPTLMELAALMESVPVDGTADNKNVFMKLKDGYRNVILGVVDSGVTSFLKFADVGFGDELLYQRNQGARRGGKFGGRGGRGGRGRGGARGGRGQGGK